MRKDKGTSAIDAVGIADIRMRSQDSDHLAILNRGLILDVTDNTITPIDRYMSVNDADLTALYVLKDSK